MGSSAVSYGPLREQPLENPPRNPGDAVVLADLDPELHGLPLGIPAGILGERRLGKGAPRAILLGGAVGRRTRTSGGSGEMTDGRRAQPFDDG